MVSKQSTDIDDSLAAHQHVAREVDTEGWWQDSLTAQSYLASVQVFPDSKMGCG